jgi:hypothetical protein
MVAGATGPPGPTRAAGKVICNDTSLAQAVGRSSSSLPHGARRHGDLPALRVRGQPQARTGTSAPADRPPRSWYRRSGARATNRPSPSSSAHAPPSVSSLRGSISRTSVRSGPSSRAYGSSEPPMSTQPPARTRGPAASRDPLELGDQRRLPDARLAADPHSGGLSRFAAVKRRHQSVELLGSAHERRTGYAPSRPPHSDVDKPGWPAKPLAGRAKTGPSA